MTNGLAVALVLLVAGFLVLDGLVLHLGAPLFLARRGLALVEWLAFWR